MVKINNINLTIVQQKQNEEDMYVQPKYSMGTHQTCNNH